MALNFGILQPVNIAGNIMAGQQETQRNQLAQQQMQTGALQQEKAGMDLEQAMREREGLAKMQKAFIANGKSGNLDANFDEMIQSGIPNFVEIGIKGKQSLQNQKNFESLLKGDAPAAATATPSAAPAPSILELDTFDVNAPPVVAAPIPTLAQRSATAIGTNLPPAGVQNQLAPAPAASVNQLATQPNVIDLRRKIDAAYALGTPQALAWAQSREKELAELTKPQTAPEAVLMQKLGYPLTPEGYQAFRDAQRQERMLTPEEEKQKVRIAAATRAPAQPATPAAPVAVVGADGKVKYVSREEAISKGMTPANAMEGLAPKEIQAREAKFPAATSAVKTFESSADKLAADLERLAKHPGLSGISGVIYGRTPALTKDARAAQALYDSIVARGGFQELQNMRASSPTGGALGNVSDREGQYLRDAFAPINRTQDTADLSRVLKDAANAARVSKQRVREAYDLTYDYKNQGGAVTSPVSSGGKIVDFGSLK
jgi:hypothetical protein